MVNRVRLDSKMEALSAKHLVVGLLLIDSVLAYLAPPGQRDYDVVAVDADQACRTDCK